MGRVAFPDLVVRDREDTLRDLVDNSYHRNKCRKLILDNRALMNEGTRIYNEEKNAVVTEEQVGLLLHKLRGKL